MKLTPTARAILGFLSLQPRSGYEIRAAARRSVNLFWGVSDGQLYPQLHDLSDRGLIAAVGEPEGKQARQYWQLTEDGRQALQEWVTGPTEPSTLRDESLVKLLFADQFGTQALREVVAGRRAALVGIQDQLQEITPGERRPVPDSEAGLLGPGLVHSFGLDFVAMSIAWCDQALIEIDRHETASTRDSGA